MVMKKWRTNVPGGATWVEGLRTVGDSLPWKSSVCLKNNGSMRMTAARKNTKNRSCSMCIVSEECLGS